MTGRSATGFEAETSGGRKAVKAKIISIDEAMGLMTIECPGDIQQHEVPIGTKEFMCPIDGTLLLIS